MATLLSIKPIEISLPLPIIKADGGAIGLTENPSALWRWMVAGPEVSRLVSQYEIEAQNQEAIEQSPQAQKTFKERVESCPKL